MAEIILFNTKAITQEENAQVQNFLTKEREPFEFKKFFSGVIGGAQIIGEEISAYLDRASQRAEDRKLPEEEKKEIIGLQFSDIRNLISIKENGDVVLNIPDALQETSTSEEIERITDLATQALKEETQIESIPDKTITPTDETFLGPIPATATAEQEKSFRETGEQITTTTPSVSTQTTTLGTTVSGSNFQATDLNKPLFTSLVDILDSRPGLEEAIKQAGLTVDEWWNQHGTKEYPNVTLVDPGSSEIQDPKTLTAEAQISGGPVTTEPTEITQTIPGISSTGGVESPVIPQGTLDVKIDTRESATSLTGQPQLVSFTSGPSQFKVWDVSGGILRHVTAEEFKTRGFDQSQVQKINPGQVILDRADGESKVFATILGNRVSVDTIQNFQDADFKFENVDVITTQQRAEEVKTGNLIRFTTKNQVFDTSTGELNPISATEFARLGLDFADVQLIDPLNVGVTKDPNTQVISININGKDIRVRDVKQFDETGLSRTIFLGERAVAPALGTLSNELKWRPNLGKVWESRTDLQELYERPDNLSRGESKDARTEGTNMETWAMLHGWLEEPDLLEAWRPENAVRVSYWQIFGQDPFDVATLQQAALKWAESVRVGDITSVDSLRGRINLDNGTSYNDLPEKQQQQITIDWLIEPEEVVDKGIPSFQDFFDEQAARARIEKETEKFFNVEMESFLRERGIEERRSIEDWARLIISEDLTDDEIKQLQEGETNVQDLTAKLKKEGREVGGELTELQERDLTSIEKSFRNTLFQATEGFGRRGLIFSSLRIQEENQLRESLSRGATEIQKSFERQRESATLAKERTIETLVEKQRQLEAEQAVEIPKEIETALTQEREIQRTKFETLREQAVGEELAGGIT